MQNFVSWFEIPVKDIERAMAFYSKVFNIEMKLMEGAPVKYAMFPHEPGFASGALAEDKDLVCQKGTLVYLNGGDDLSVPLKRVAAAGGKVLEEKMDIGDHGFIAVFLDSEGNRVALHSMK